MPLPPNPTVSIYFTGLLAFCFGERNEYCQVGVHSSTDDHELRLRIVKRRPAPVIESAQSVTFSHYSIRRMPALWVDVEGAPAPEQKAAKPFVAGDPAQPPTDPQDFRHVVDLGGESFYNRRLRVLEDVFSPSIFFAKGLFYSSVLTPTPYRTLPVEVDRMDHTHAHSHVATASEEASTAPGRGLGRIAEYAGANLYFNHPRQEVVIRIGRGGQELFRLRNEENATYEIMINNGTAPHTPVGNHFGHYYDGVQLNPGEPRILLAVDGVTTLGDAGGLCTIARFSKNTRLGAGG